MSDDSPAMSKLDSGRVAHSPLNRIFPSNSDPEKPREQGQADANRLLASRTEQFATGARRRSSASSQRRRRRSRLPEAPFLSAPRRFSDPTAESSFLALWAEERFSLARAAAGLSFVALVVSGLVLGIAFARGSIRVAGSNPGADPVRSLEQSAPQLTIVFGVATLAFATLALALVGPRGSLLRRHWQGIASVAIASAYACSFVVSKTLQAPSVLLVSIASASLAGSTVLSLRCIQIVALNCVGVALAFGLAASLGDSPQAWEAGISLPICIGAAVVSSAVSSAGEKAARAAFTQKRQSADEVTIFREEHSPLLIELGSYCQTSESLGLSSTPMVSALSLLGALFQNLLDGAKMQEAQSAASAIRHLLTITSIKGSTTVSAALKEIDAPTEDGDLLNAFRDWMKTQAGETDDETRAMSMRRRKSSGNTGIPSAGSRGAGALNRRSSSLVGAAADPRPQITDALSGDLGEAVAAAASSCWSDFDAIFLESASGGRPLEILACDVARRALVLDGLEVDAGKFRAFVAAVESGYNRVPYHTSTHAADVLQAVQFLIHYGGMRSQLRTADVLAALVAAIVHDMCHSGRNNSFEVATQSELAMLYNDQSVLENHSLTRALALLRDPATNFIGHLSKEKRTHFRRTVIACVLATDMARHFEKLAEFKARALAVSLEAVKGDESMRRSASLNIPMIPPEAAPPLAEADRILFLSMCLKVADLANSARPLYQHVQWTNRVSDEFHSQGDEEKRLGLPVSPYCDRDTSYVSQTTAGFLSFLAIPLFQSWASFFPAARVLVENAERNLAHWKAADPHRKVPPVLGSPSLAGATGARRTLPPILVSTRPASRVSVSDNLAVRRGSSAQPSPSAAAGASPGSDSDGPSRRPTRRKGSIIAAAQDAIAAFGAGLRRASGAGLSLPSRGAAEESLELLSARNSMVA